MADFGALGWMQLAGGLLSLFGSQQAGKAETIDGQRARDAAEFAAWQAKQQAGNAIAIGQRHALEAGRQARLVMSRNLAVAAASGGGASDPTIMRLIADASGQGAYKASVALYEGEAKARQLRLDAAAGRVSGAEAALEGATRGLGYVTRGIGSGIRTASSLYAKYGGDGPSGSGDSALIQEPGSDPMRDH